MNQFITHLFILLTITFFEPKLLIAAPSKKNISVVPIKARILPSNQGSTLSLTPSKTNLLVLEINEVYTLPNKGPIKINIENKNFLKFKFENDKLLIQGTQTGVAQIRIGSQIYKVVTLTKLAWKNNQLLLAVLSQCRGLTLDFADGFFLIQGHLDHISTWLSLAELGVNQYKMMVETSLQQIKIIEYEINKKLLQKGLFPITIDPSPLPSVRLSPTLVKNTIMTELLSQYGLSIKEDDRQLATEPLIRVQVLIAEIRKSYAQNIGIEWPTEVSAKILPQGLIPSGSDLNMMAHFLATQGHGKVLAHPTLLTKSGSEAEFFAGGEFPIKTRTLQTQTVLWKKYGITLKIKPHADSDGKLSLDLNSEISSIDSGEKIDGIPALFTNTLSSHFDLHQSETIALSGLIKKINGEALKEWPGWSAIPILGSLFSSREYQEDKTELTVFVTPSIVNK